MDSATRRRHAPAAGRPTACQRPLCPRPPPDGCSHDVLQTSAHGPAPPGLSSAVVASRASVPLAHIL
eukprot:365028-Chlamydomonas_euryale.AAC.13